MVSTNRVGRPASREVAPWASSAEDSSPGRPCQLGTESRALLVSQSSLS